MKIVNLTQHDPSKEQIEAGVVDLSPARRKRLIDLLNFKELPTYGEVYAIAVLIADLVESEFPEEFASGNLEVMLGGASFLMHPLHEIFADSDIRARYSFSLRVSEEFVNADGETVKTSRHKHIGWV